VIRTSLATALLTLSLAAPGLAVAADGDKLPNLDQAAPADIRVFDRGYGLLRRYQLGFESATGNVGEGPLTIHGYRRPGQRSMRVDQLVATSDGRSRQIRSVGVMRYVVHPDHRHWHFIGFARYELRRGKSGRALLPRGDRKTGFCLGDRYALPGARRLEGFSPFPQQADQCGLGKPGLRGLFAGISVGYGDAYGAFIEGQYISLGGLPAGRYTLVHTANPDRTLLESDYRNNSASAALRLSWPRGSTGRPRVKVLKRCEDSARCG
jgi:hypothetical protein